MDLRKSGWRDGVESLAIAVLAIIFVQCFVLRSFLVKGISMQPTFEGDERVLVEKLSYQLRLPKTGDIVVIVPPRSPQPEIYQKGHCRAQPDYFD